MGDVGRQRVGVNREAAEWLRLLGVLVRAGRVERGWRQEDLAWRIGASTNTVAAIEKGSAAVSVGLVLNAASLVGIPFLGADDRASVTEAARTAETIAALLPQRVARRRPVEPESVDELDF